MDRKYLQKVSEIFYMFGILDNNIKLRNIELEETGKINIREDSNLNELEKRIKSLDCTSLKDFSLLETPKQLKRKEDLSLFNRQTERIESLYTYWDKWRIRGYLPVISFKKFQEKNRSDSNTHIKIYSLFMEFKSSRETTQILTQVYSKYKPKGSIEDSKKVSLFELHPFEN